MIPLPTLGPLLADGEETQMATRNRRDEWHQVNGKWTRSLGFRGTRVRLFQKRKDGTFYRTVWVAGSGRTHASILTRDRAEAERLGRLLLSELLRQEELTLPGRLTLWALWDRYKRECAAFLDNKPDSRRDDESRVKVLLAFFGERCEVRTLTARDQATYSARRKAGGITLRNGKKTRGVRARSVEMDLVLLHAILSWATTVRVSNGSRLLDVNPLAGVRREREQNPVRPIASWERFTRTRKAMRGLGDAAESVIERIRWTKMELALVLAEATGRRLGSIRQLRWEDIDVERGTIRWRAEFDKKGREWVVPCPSSLIDDLKQFRKRLGVIGEWLFAGERKPERPMDRHLFDKWLRVAEEQAKLPKLVGGLWHPYRRKWATERKHHSLKDVAAAGGWKDTETLLTCYQQPDTETILAVMSEQRKVRDAALGSATG
jgi:integrase